MPAETSVPYTVVGVPIQARETTLGVLGILSRGPDGMTSQAVQLLLAVGHQIGMAIENIRLLDEASELQILREVDRLRSELIANVSHELRTPLGLIKVSSTALTMDEVEFDLETQRRFLLGIEEEVGNLERIVDQLLDVSRMESSKLQVDRRPTDLGQLARRVMEAVKPQLERHVLAYEFPEDPLVASVDARQVEQVLRNLLENAIKYSPHGGTIKVQGERRGSKITVCVSDEGIGVPAEEQERIFERFYRVDDPVTRRVRGLGLGLSICQWIVEAHGGAIWVQGAPHAGSTFCFALPSGFPGLDSPPESVRV
jgi:K+-sensing histidine kinase KdpD